MIFVFREPHYLTITNATREDRGRFTCLATNEAGTFEQSYTVNVLVPPKLENENKAFLEETVLVNRQASVSCFIVAESLLDIEWWKDGQPLTSLKPGTSLDSSKKRLTFSQVEIDDAGNYTCVASNQAGQINITTSLQVLVPPFWKKVPNQDEIFGKDGVSLDLECDAGGFPAPSLLWLKDGQILEAESANIAIKDNGRVLRILSPSDKDSGQYSCVATNPAGTLEKNVKVSIRVPPSLLYVPISKIKVLENRAVTFDCPVEGKPAPEITWLLDREIIDEKSPFIRFSNQRKHLHYLRVTGSGNIIFSCVAKNPVGELVTDFFTEVLRPP
ncbi:Titin, partial [Armadillidium nasatum]